MLQVTLVENREDRVRYAVLVSYEWRGAKVGPPRDRWTDKQGRAIAVRREWAWLNSGRGWTWTVVRVTELREPPGLRGREWPRKMDRPFEETEDLRRARIMALRARVHVDQQKGAEEPDWDRAAEAFDHLRTAHRDELPEPGAAGGSRNVCRCPRRQQALADDHLFSQIMAPS